MVACNVYVKSVLTDRIGTLSDYDFIKYSDYTLVAIKHNMNWIYTTNEDNSARFVLGEYNNVADKTMICVGVNPSTATPDNLDPTLRKVKLIAKRHGYVNWIMINIYPQRATNPSDLHPDRNGQLHSRNLHEINNLLGAFYSADILFAYGDLINTRPYLKECLGDILRLTLSIQLTGKQFCIKRTKKGNPAHPLYQKADCQFIPF